MPKKEDMHLVKFSGKKADKEADDWIKCRKDIHIHGSDIDRWPKVDSCDVHIYYYILEDK